MCHQAFLFRFCFRLICRFHPYSLALPDRSPQRCGVTVHMTVNMYFLSLYDTVSVQVSENHLFQDLFTFMLVKWRQPCRTGKFHFVQSGMTSLTVWWNCGLPWWPWLPVATHSKDSVSHCFLGCSYSWAEYNKGMQSYSCFLTLFTLPIVSVSWYWSTYDHKLIINIFSRRRPPQVPSRHNQWWRKLWCRARRLALCSHTVGSVSTSWKGLALEVQFMLSVSYVVNLKLLMLCFLLDI